MFQMVTENEESTDESNLEDLDLDKVSSQSPPQIDTSEKAEGIVYVGHWH